MSLTASHAPSTAFPLMLKTLSMSNEFLDETNPFFLSSNQSTATCFVLLYLLKPLFMSYERLLQLVHGLDSSQLGQFLQFMIGKPFGVENQVELWRLWCRNLVQRSTAGFGPGLIPFDHTFFQWCHGNL